jgi:hypothetical protein
LPLEDGLSKPFTKYVDISQNGRFEWWSSIPKFESNLGNPKWIYDELTK